MSYCNKNINQPLSWIPFILQEIILYNNWVEFSLQYNETAFTISQLLNSGTQPSQPKLGCLALTSVTMFLVTFLSHFSNGLIHKWVGTKVGWNSSWLELKLVGTQVDWNTSGLEPGPSGIVCCNCVCLLACLLACLVGCLCINSTHVLYLWIDLLN